MQLAIFWIYALVLFINIRLGALEVQANATSFIASPISKPSPTDVSTMEITSSHVTLSRSSSSPYTSLIEANASAISPTDSAKNVSTLILQSNNSVTSVVATTSVTSAQANESVTSTQMFNRSVTINTTYVVQSTAVTPTLIAAPTLSLSTSYSTMTTNVTKSEPSSVTPDMTTSESPGVTPGVTISEPSRVTPSVTPTNVTLSTVSLNITTTIPPTTAQLQAPNIESPSQKVVELEKGKMLNLSCKATGNPKPTISWEKDNNAIKNGSLLVIKNISPSDGGEYTCHAKNTIGHDKITIDVKVLFAPTIIPPSQKEYREKKGEMLTLDCVAEGNPTPTILWEKDNTSIKSSPFVKIQGPLLFIKKLRPDDAGEYKCFASNSKGTDVMTIEVKVLYISDVIIAISKRGSDIAAAVVKEGDNVDITCTAESSPRPVITLKKNGERLHISSMQDPLGNRRYKKTISLSNVKRKVNAGKYTCTAESSGNTPKNSSKMLEIDFSSPPTYPPPMKLRRTPETISIPIHKIRYLKNGMEVKYVQIVVLELPDDVMPKRPSNAFKDNELGPYKGNRSIPYIAGVMNVDDTKDFVIGDGKTSFMRGRARRQIGGSQKYDNVPLRPDKYYTAFQRMVAKDTINYNSLPWIHPTKTIQTPTHHPPHSNYNIIIGCVIGILVILIIAVVAFAIHYYVKKKRQNQSIRSEKYEINGMGPLGKMARTFSMHMARINEHYHPPNPIPVDEFPQHVTRMHKSGDMLFSTEYERIRDDHSIPATHSIDPNNQWKNRFTNIVTYDHNRVKLIPFDDEPASDYINASYIDGYEGVTYIATQGPLDETCGDFWRMVWEQETRVIVMLTNLRERGRPKCFQYWPSSGSFKFEGALVTLVDQIELSSHTIRVLRLSMSDSDETRLIKQFHFTSWPDHGVPRSVAFLLSFVRETVRANPSDAGPMVVHCSAGVGRTGTFIVIDTMLRQIAKEKTVDIFHYVIQLRKQRNLMVQTEQQYIFIHDALYDVIVSGDTEIHASKIRSHVEDLTELTQESDEPTLAKEFQRLLLGVKPRLTASEAKHSANKHKNRYHNTFPYDDTRVQLSVQVAVTGSDYINASFIDGYRKKKAFIATQAPLPETFSDFWRMVWEQECFTIVTLAQEMENTKQKMDRYWPTSHPITYGNLQVELIEEEKKESFDIRVFKITNNQDESSRSLRQYHFMEWTSDDITDSESGLLSMIGEIGTWQQESGNHVITVHCSAGVGRTGVFCAVCSLIERLKAEALVDVFTTVKLLREQRPAMVQTKIQYEYCYRVLLVYLDMHSSLEQLQSCPVDVVELQTARTPTKSLDSDKECNHVTFELAEHDQQEVESDNQTEESEPNGKEKETADINNEESSDMIVQDGDVEPVPSVSIEENSSTVTN